MSTTIPLGKMTLRCKKCGGDQFIHPDAVNLQSEVSCRQCAWTGTVGQLADPQAVDEAKRLAAEAFRTATRK